MEEQPGDKSETAEKIGSYYQIKSRGERPQVFPDHFGIPSKNIVYIKQSKEPPRTELSH